MIVTATVTREHLDQYPIWANYSAWDELEEIESWGEAGQQIVSELHANHLSDWQYFPVLELDDSWLGFREVVIRATITTADGTDFPGWVSDNECVGIFVENDEFFFAGSPSEWAEKSLSALRKTTGLALSPFFPLRYKTEFREPEGVRIEGFVSCGNLVSQFLQDRYGVNFQRFDDVRVVSLRVSEREVYEREQSSRSPRVGDLGRIIRCYDPAEHSAPFVVINKDYSSTWNDTLWCASFAADELELINPDGTSRI